MRVLPLVVALLLVALSGCFGPEDSSDTPPLLVDQEATCDVVLYLDGSQGPRLVKDAPAAGSRAGNGFAEAFLTNDMEEWQGSLVEICGTGAWLVEGPIRTILQVESNIAPAPIVLGGEPGEGYHFFNQLGDDSSGFLQGYDVEYAPILSTPGSVATYEFEYPADPGGWWIASGATIRWLLTSLVLDGPDFGHKILFGGDNPSRLEFTARKVEPAPLLSKLEEQYDVNLEANQGLLTGAIPAQEGLNVQHFPFTIYDATAILQIELFDRSSSMVKGDADLNIQSLNGEPLWSIGSPYSYEAARVHERTLEEIFPPGNYVLEVTGYSTVNYQGTVVVTSFATERLQGWVSLEG